MPLNWSDITKRAQAFSQKWEKADGREEAESQSFIHELLHVFGVHDAQAVGTFEYRVGMDDEQANGYIDYLWPKKIFFKQRALCPALFCRRQATTHGTYYQSARPGSHSHLRPSGSL